MLGSTRLYGVGLMSLPMIQDAYMPVYSYQDFWHVQSYRRAGLPEECSTRGPRGPKKDFTEEKVHSVIVIMFSPNIQ